MATRHYGDQLFLTHEFQKVIRVSLLNHSFVDCGCFLNLRDFPPVKRSSTRQDHHCQVT